jgi:hypothetical protein
VGVRSLLARLAARAPVPVFVVTGQGARETVQRLRLSSEVLLVPTPRAANVLLVAGIVPTSQEEAVRRLHDAVSHPRAVLSWPLSTGAGPPPWLDVAAVIEEGDPVPTIVRVHRELLERHRASTAAVLPDVEPNEWRGVGPYGQGGKGMTGGVPYGRPMAERADDRDGLTLDQIRIRLGPYLPPLPPGLALDVAVQGDVLQEVEVAGLPGGPDDEGCRAAAGGDLEPFVRALDEPIPVATLEVARARAHLRWVADALVAHELPSLAVRVGRLADRVGAGDGDAVRALERTLRRTRLLGWATRGVGVLDRADLEGLEAGPVGRASGLRDDARSEDPAYQRVGFAPIVEDAGDAAARWRVRVREAAAALELANRVGDATTGGDGRVEGPRGVIAQGSAPTARLLPLVERVLIGAEWGDAVTTLVSLDLDLDEVVSVGAGVAERTG